MPKKKSVPVFHLINDQANFLELLKFCAGSLISLALYCLAGWVAAMAGLHPVVALALSAVIALGCFLAAQIFFVFREKPDLKKSFKLMAAAAIHYLIFAALLVILGGCLAVSKVLVLILSGLLLLPLLYFFAARIIRSRNPDPETESTKTLTAISIAKAVVPYLLLMIFSLFFYRYFLTGDAYLALIDRDNVSQLLYFMPFLQKSFLSGDIFWSWSAGLGGDVFGEFSYYYTTSPFFYLMLFVRRLGVENPDLGGILDFRLAFAILKQFLAMAFMYGLLRYEKRKAVYALIGALAYGGSMFYFKYSLTFDFMTDAMVWVPMTVLAIKTYEKTKKPGFLIACFAITIASNFYFAYINLIFYGLYILFHIRYDGENLAGRIKNAGKQIAPYLAVLGISFLIAALAFLPAILAFAGSDRFAADVSLPWLKEPGFYTAMPERVFQFLDVVGVPAAALIIFFLPFKKLESAAKRKTIMALLFALLYLIPFAYSLFNGFSHQYDRWLYLFVFTVAYALPDWLEENEKNKHAGLKFFIVCGLLFLFNMYTKPARGIGAPSPFDLPYLILFLAMILAAALIRYMKIKALRTVCAVFLLLTVAGQSLINQAVLMDGFEKSGDFPDTDYLQNVTLDNAEVREVFEPLKPGENEFYRVIYKDMPFGNMPLYYEYYGASSYNSLMNKNVHLWMKKDANIINSIVTPSFFMNLDNRLFLEAMFGVKYVVQRDTDQSVPYGFTLKEQKNGYRIFENSPENLLGFDVWYESAVLQESYEQAHAANRDAWSLQTAAVDRIPSGVGGFQEASDTTREIRIDKSEYRFDGVTWTGKTLLATDGSSFEIPLEDQSLSPDGEILVHMRVKNLAGSRMTIHINGKGTLKEGADYKWNYPVDDYTFRFDGDTKKLKISFSAGVQVVEEFKIYYNSYKDYGNWISERNKVNLENLTIRSNSVSGIAKTADTGILALSIPYHEGWKATVNGKSRELIKVNGILSGLVLEPGEHRIELTYITSGFVPGLVITLISSYGCVLYLLLRKRIKRGSKNP